MMATGSYTPVRHVIYLTWESGPLFRMAGYSSTKATASVAMIVADAFRKKKLNYEPRKLAKTVRIFVEIEHIKNQGHILA